jgi:hypothetical protein
VLAGTVDGVTRRRLYAAAALLLVAAAAVAAAALSPGGTARAAPGALAAGPSPAGTRAAGGRAAGVPGVPRARHVVIVGIPGLRWSEVSARTSPSLWGVAAEGSVGSLVDYAVIPHTCPADGWLTLNAGSRAMTPHSEDGPCPALPTVVPGSGEPGAPAAARIPAMPSIVAYNKRLHYSPRWGLLASAAGNGGCATAAGPGAALALAGPAGRVGSYLPSASGLSRAVLARCPLTVVDLGALPATSVPGTSGAAGSPGGAAARTAAIRHADAGLGAIIADLPPGTILLVTAPGAGGTPHLRVTVVSGPGFRAGMLGAASTRHPGMVVLTDLTPTVLRWLGQPVPAGTVGSQITRTGRASLDAAVSRLDGQDIAAQVWTRTHIAFFWAYTLADVAVLAGIGLIFWGGQEDRRRRRAALWRVAGVLAGAVPAATFLASLVPWWTLPRPAAWLYGLAAAWTAVIGVAALAGPWRRQPLGPPGAVALVTVAVIGLDVMTGSRLQMSTPFGLSVLEAGRFYGIGNEAVGIYAVCGMLAAGWLASAALRPRPCRVSEPAAGCPGERPAEPLEGAPRRWRDHRRVSGAAAARARPARRGLAAAAAAAVAVFAVFACGWPGFGAKAGGTIAMVPAFLLLLMVTAGVRISSRRVALVLVSGIALFAVFALVNYAVPATGPSDIGAFAGNLLHGRAGGLLDRKATSMIGSLALSSYSPLVPLAVAAAGLVLLRPSWFAIRALPRGYSAEPLLRITLAMMWLTAVLGWFADDSGIIVPAAALPLAVPLVVAVLAGFPGSGGEPARRGGLTMGLFRGDAHGGAVRAR